MASKGYILNGVYHKVEEVPLSKMVRTQQSMYKQGDHARQRFDHAGEILQPHTIDGKPNPKFIEAFPSAAMDYGFLPDTRKKAPMVSNTPNPGDKGYGGSTPWDYSARQQTKT